MKRNFLLALLALTTATTVRAEKTSQTFKIGVTVPLTGDFATYGEQIRSGVELAKISIAKRGLKLKVFYENACLPTESISSITKLSSIDHIQGLVSFCNIAMPAMAPIIQTKQIPAIQVGGISDSVLALGGYIFSTDVRVQTEAIKLAEYATNTLQVRTVSILYILTAFGEDYSKHFTERFEELGGKVLSSNGTAIGVNDFRAELLSIKRKKPEIIFAVHLGDTLGVLLKQARETGLTQPYLGTYEAGSPGIIDVTKNGAARIDFFEPLPLNKSAQMAAFESEYQSKFEAKPGLLEATSYDAVTLLVKYLEECNGETICVKEELTKNHSYQGVSGPFSLVASEKSLREYNLKKISSVKVIDTSELNK